MQRLAGKLPVFFSIVALAATGFVKTDCSDSGTNPALMQTTVEYKTQPGDTPYNLAKQFYGKGYMEYKIREANKTLLTAQGFFPPGTRIVIPADDRGRPADVTRPDNVKY